MGITCFSEILVDSVYFTEYEIILEFITEEAKLCLIFRYPNQAASFQKFCTGR
jgi:hypothetical protein